VRCPWTCFIACAAACDATPQPPSPVDAYLERSPQVVVTPTPAVAPAPTFDVHGATLIAIGRDIEALAERYPALEKFDAHRHLDLERSSIAYEYRVKRVVVERGIKRELVVQPDPEGLYLFIDFHPDVEANESRAQVFRGHYRNRDRRVTYVARPGERTGDLGERLWTIMHHHGTVNLGLSQISP
jgi:hypothetical protein